MRRLEPWLALALAGAMIAAAIAAPWLRFVLTIALAKGIAVLGILLLLRAGQVSFGHALYVAFGAYAVAFLAPELNDALLLLAAAGVASGLLGLVIGLFVSRYRQIFFGMLNLAMAMVFYSLLEKLYHVTKGSDGIRVEVMPIAGQVLDRVAYEWTIFGIALALALALSVFLRLYLASPMGEALAAIKTRETRLEFMGVPARGVLLAAYVMSAITAGFGGAIIAMTSRHVTPLLAYWTSSGELVFIAILGGAGGVLGPFLGAATYRTGARLCRGLLRRCLADDPGRGAAAGDPVRAGRAVGHGGARHRGAGAMSGALLQASGLRLAFGGVKAADGIDLSVMRGEFLAIIGPNGAGKTTFINMTTGYLRPQGGSITYEGRRINGMSPRAIVKLGIARSFQLPQLFLEHTVLQNVALAVASRDGIWSAVTPLLRRALSR